ncbi:Mitochondrial fission 1 protein [Leucoagaricus gongylophorus]
MATELPYAADAEVSLSYDELDVLRRQYQKELSESHVTIQTKFNYAWGLVKSPIRDHQVEGVQLLQGDFLCISRSSQVDIIPPSSRDIQGGTYSTTRMSFLPCTWPLQDGQL